LTQLIAETAWHHEGDIEFMRDLVGKLCDDSKADVIKMHITLDLDSYMARDHDAYNTLKKWVLSEEEWCELIAAVEQSNKKLMLLLNDNKAIELASEFKLDYVELHSVCLNVPRLQECLLKNIDPITPVVIGVGGCTLEEIDSAISVFRDRQTILMFGFQNYPTRYEDVNLRKIRKIQSLYSDNKFGYADHTAWDEPNNELITLLVASNGMDFVEKHVTTKYGIERCDYSAAVSIPMLNQLGEKLKTLDGLKGTGEIGLHAGERIYSQYGPMKMAAIAKKSMDVGGILGEADIEFIRTASITKMSQTDIVKNIGKSVKKKINKGQILDWSHFEGS
jgi:N,N'-diacetyllegionaminate synthase